MHGLISLLPEPYYQMIEDIWRQLEIEFGIKGIFVTPYPHFSWQIARDYEFNELEKTMKEISDKSKSFSVKTTGLGIFTGENPVIFIPIVKNRGLINFHNMLWERLRGFGEDVSLHYNPYNWVPHISLAYEDVSREKAGLVVRKLASERFNWNFDVDNIALIYELEGEIGELKCHYKFQS